jgi:hypothetical protein
VKHHYTGTRRNSRQRPGKTASKASVRHASYQAEAKSAPGTQYPAWQSCSTKQNDQIKKLIDCLANFVLMLARSTRFQGHEFSNFASKPHFPFVLSHREIQFQKFQKIHIKMCTKEQSGDGLEAEKPFVRPLFC